jgi:hypothetical protein
MTATTAACQWCGLRFTPRPDGGRLQRYCSPECRRAFDAAARRFVAAAITDGRLTVAALRDGNALAATRALSDSRSKPAAVPGSVAITVPAWAVDTLVELGALDPSQRGDRGAVTFAVLMEIAVTAALRRRGAGI